MRINGRIQNYILLVLDDGDRIGLLQYWFRNDAYSFSFSRGQVRKFKVARVIHRKSDVDVCLGYYPSSNFTICPNKRKYAYV